MSDDLTPSDERPDEAAVAAFATRLEALAAELPPRERRVLDVLLLAAMDPVERMRWRRVDDLLRPGEQQLLEALAREKSQGSP